jgi:hypothetical protein
MIDDFGKHLAKREKWLKNAEVLKDAHEAFERRSEHISSNLPEHLPGRESRYEIFKE